MYIYLFIYFLNEEKCSHFEIKKISKGQMQCQNATIKVFDSSLTKINIFTNEHLNVLKDNGIMVDIELIQLTFD
jgi:hypothetical protein